MVKQLVQNYEWLPLIAATCNCYFATVSVLSVFLFLRGEWVILSRRVFFIEDYFRGTQSPPPRNFNDFLIIVYQSRNPRGYTIFCNFSIFCMLRKNIFFFSHSLAFCWEISPKLMKIETKTYKFDETVGKKIVILQNPDTAEEKKRVRKTSKLRGGRDWLPRKNSRLVNERRDRITHAPL